MMKRRRIHKSPFVFSYNFLSLLSLCFLRSYHHSVSLSLLDASICISIFFPLLFVVALLRINHCFFLFFPFPFPSFLFPSWLVILTSFPSLSAVCDYAWWFSQPGFHQFCRCSDGLVHHSDFRDVSGLYVLRRSCFLAARGLILSFLSASLVGSLLACLLVCDHARCKLPEFRGERNQSTTETRQGYVSCEDPASVLQEVCYFLFVASICLFASLFGWVGLCRCCEEAEWDRGYVFCEDPASMLQAVCFFLILGVCLPQWLVACLLVCELREKEEHNRDVSRICFLWRSCLPTTRGLWHSLSGREKYKKTHDSVITVLDSPVSVINFFSLSSFSFSFSSLSLCLLSFLSPLPSFRSHVVGTPRPILFRHHLLLRLLPLLFLLLYPLHLFLRLTQQLLPFQLPMCPLFPQPQLPTNWCLCAPSQLVVVIRKQINLVPNCCLDFWKECRWSHICPKWLSSWIEESTVQQVCHFVIFQFEALVDPFSSCYCSSILHGLFFLLC